MPRWRSPSPRSSPYITASGYRRLEQELKALWERRAEVTRALSAAAAEGDRSENAEYIYRKKELRGIDSRIRFLQKRLPALKIVDRVSDTTRVFFGARVTLEDEDGREVSYRIVGADELDSDGGDISVDSPLARALLGKGVDEEITVETAQGRKEYVVLAVNYD
jgi:transcription elongation factor GreB